jgi:hypothetical protein
MAIRYQSTVVAYKSARLRSMRKSESPPLGSYRQPHRRNGTTASVAVAAARPRIRVR